MIGILPAASVNLSFLAIPSIPNSSKPEAYTTEPPQPISLSSLTAMIEDSALTAINAASGG